VGGETLNFSGQSGQFDTKNVGTGKAVTVTGLILGDGSGAATNYSVTQPVGVTGNITAKALTASYTAANKVFDGGTSAAVTGSSADVIIGDGISFSQTAAFATAAVGAAKTVNISSIALGGADVGNYALQNTTASASANITAAPAVVTPVVSSIGSTPGSTSVITTQVNSVPFNTAVNDAISTSFRILQDIGGISINLNMMQDFRNDFEEGLGFSVEEQ